MIKVILVQRERLVRMENMVTVVKKVTLAQGVKPDVLVLWDLRDVMERWVQKVMKVEMVVRDLLDLLDPRAIPDSPVVMEQRVQKVTLVVME